eukprot:TRINITY_DN4952_c0_g1_i1.p1 TRINITY_DN4952_c0_g1~~TRINITY_DN4952_c0_g1_i1.p1  ORF type:complete len:202 (-),score=27.89 TRINITY_DN4952_c0_g1_i1:432-1037(-)
MHKVLIMLVCMVVNINCISSNYTITVTCSGPADTCNMWAHTTLGTFMGDDTFPGMVNGAACPEQSVYSIGPDGPAGTTPAGLNGASGTHTFMWMSPDNGTVPCATLSVAAAFGPTSAYYTAVASTWCWEGATSMGPGPAMAPPVEGMEGDEPPAAPSTTEPPAPTPDAAVSFLGAMMAAVCALAAFVAVQSTLSSNYVLAA